MPPASGQTVSATFRSLWVQFRSAWKTLLAIHLIFLALGFVLLGPLSAGCLNFAVSFSGESALSDTDIVAFLSTPAGALLSLLAATVLLTTSILGYAALLVCARTAAHRIPANYLDGIACAGAATPAILRLALRFILNLLATALPFVAVIGLIYSVFLGHNDINYYLAEKPPRFLWAVGLAGFVAVCMCARLIAVAAGWFYAPPLVLFQNLSPANARRLSLDTARGTRQTIFISIVAWLFGTPLIIGLLSTPVSIASLWIVPRLTHHLPTLALILGMLSILGAILAFVVGFLTLSLLALQHIRLYHNAGLERTPPSVNPTTPTWQIPIGAKSLGAVAILTTVVAAASSYYWIQHIALTDTAVIIAHRGASASAPENTMAAIRQGLDDGAEWIEIDVQETADGVVVVFHDSDFKRLGATNLTVWDVTSAQLPSIDIGSWFAPEFSSERTPTLKEVLELCKGRSGVLIELKYYGHDQRLEERVVEIVEAANMVDHVMLMSLKLDGIKKIRALRPQWKIGLLSSIALGNLTKLDLDFLGLNARAASPRLIKQAHQAGIDVYVWTVNTPMDMSSMLSRGVDGLITDEPKLAREILAQRASLNPAERLLLELTATLGGQPASPEQ